MRKFNSAGQQSGDRAKMVAITLSVAILVISTAMVSWACAGQKADKGDKKGKKEKEVMAGSAITGGPYEASGVIQVPGTDKVLFVDDGRPGEVFLMQIDASGQQVGAVKAISTGAVVENPEAITSDGTYFYIVGSQSNPKRAAQNAIARFAFAAEAQSVSKVEVISDLRQLLVTNVAALKGDAEKRGVDGGLNIEGLAWDPQNQRLLLGLRSPIRSGQALLVPLKLRDSNAPFTAENINFGESQLLQVPLGGEGVREIFYDAQLKSFWLISGAPENAQRGEFILWQWDGSAGSAQPARKVTLDSAMKPEGLTEFRSGDQRFLLLMGDASRYMKMDYTSLP